MTDQLCIGILCGVSRYFEAHCGLVVIKDQLYRHNRQAGGDMQRLRSAVSHSGPYYPTGLISLAFVTEITACLVLKSCTAMWAVVR